MKNTELEKLINLKLESSKFSDFAPNGLQVEGREEIRRIVTGVTACQALLDKAVTLQADAIIVHHGYFWKNEAVEIKNMKRQRLKTLLMNDINLFGWHLPLDAHPELGNNAQLAASIGLTITGYIEPLLPIGQLQQSITPQQLTERLTQKLGRAPLHCMANNLASIKNIAICTGGGQSYIDAAADAGVDAFISGEISERTPHVASERNLHYFAAGHHATEKGGVQALGQWLIQQYDLDVIFVDIDNLA